MSSILLLSGSPSASSRTAAVLDQLGVSLRSQQHQVQHVAVRDLPADALLHGQSQHPRIMTLAGQIASCDGLVVASPVYKAAYSGLLKAITRTGHGADLDRDTAAALTAVVTAFTDTLHDRERVGASAGQR